jgi:hypothetical protein
MASSLAGQGKNLLFYGSSYSVYSWGYGVPELVQRIATEAGRPSPTIVQAIVGGATLQTHATAPNQIAAIHNSLPAGQTWDHVVVQGSSLEATSHFGFDPAVFRSNAVTILGNVRTHSPAATAVLFQTWAEAAGHMYYPTPWAGPIAMHNAIRGNYDLAVGDLNAAFGAGAAAKAAVGDAMALLEWNPQWYDPDLSHPGPAMTLLAAMCIYTSVYGTRVCDIDPDFTPGSPLALALTPHGIGEATWNHLAGLADRSAHATRRRYPGSGDHLLLESATGSDPLTACPVEQITDGTVLQLRLRSMSGVYDAAVGALMVDFILTGSPPGPAPLYPELQVDVGRVIMTPLVGLGSPLTLVFQMPFTLPGGSFLVQGLAMQASSETGNPTFTTTDGHELVFF